MLKARIIILSVTLLVMFSAVLARNATRGNFLAYMVDQTNPIPTARICTRPTLIPYSTVTTVSSAVPLTNLSYYTTTVAANSCPTVTLFHAL